MRIVNPMSVVHKSLWFTSIIQFLSLSLSFVFGVFSYTALDADSYANWVIILTVINSVFVLTSFGNDIVILRTVPKEETDLSFFSDVLSFKLLGVFLLTVPIFFYLLTSLINPGFSLIILFYIYLTQKLYIDVLSSYYKLSGRIANAIILVLIFDLLIRISVLMVINEPTIELFLFSVVVLNLILFIMTPIIVVKDLKTKLRELWTYLGFNLPLYFNSIVVFLLFNSDVLIAPKFLQGDLLAGYLFGKSIFLAFKSLIDLFFETKIIEYSKSRLKYQKWVKNFFFLYALAFVLLLIGAWYFVNNFGRFLPSQFIEKLFILMPIISVVLSSLILFPVYRHYYALTLVFCDVSAIQKSNQLTIGIIFFLSCIVFLENSMFIYIFPAVLFLYGLSHYILFRYKYLYPIS